MVGTTQFTNALVVGKDLVPVAAVRLGLPATQALPPMVDWPPHLHQLLGAHVYVDRYLGLSTEAAGHRQTAQ